MAMKSYSSQSIGSFASLTLSLLMTFFHDKTNSSLDHIHSISPMLPHSCKGAESSPCKIYFKFVRLATICNGSKQTIFASSRVELLQMISKHQGGL